MLVAPLSVSHRDGLLNLLAQLRHVLGTQTKFWMKFRMHPAWTSSRHHRAIMCRERAAEAGPKEEISKKNTQTFDKKTSASHLYMPHLLPFIDSSGCLDSIKVWEVSSPSLGLSHARQPCFFLNQGPNTATLKAGKLILEIQVAILLSTSGKKQKFQNWPGQLEVKNPHSQN